MLDDSFPNFESEVQAGKIHVLLLDLLDNAQGVEVVIETVVIARHQPIEYSFASMTKGRMPDIVNQGKRFHEVHIQPERLRNRAADLRHFQGVRQPVAEMVRITPREDLRLVLETTKGARVNNAVAVTFVL